MAKKAYTAPKAYYQRKKKSFFRVSFYSCKTQPQDSYGFFFGKGREVITRGENFKLYDGGASYSLIPEEYLGHLPTIWGSFGSGPNHIVIKGYCKCSDLLVKSGKKEYFRFDCEVTDPTGRSTKQYCFYELNNRYNRCYFPKTNLVGMTGTKEGDCMFYNRNNKRK